MRMIDRLIEAALDQRSNAVFPELSPECFRIVALVSGQTFQLVHVSGGQLRSDFGVVGPFRRAMNVENSLISGVDQERNLERIDLPVNSTQVMRRGLPAFEKRGIDGRVTGPFEEC